MDVISHGLWGGILVGRKNKKEFLTAFAFGVGPDVLSFGIFTAMTVLGLASGPDWSGGPPDPRLIPQYVHMLYNITHSLLVFLFVFVLVWAFRKRPFLPMLAWAFHILLDIPTHSTDFFATPFLWPISEYRINGIPWGHPYIFFPNLILLVGFYFYFFVIKKMWRKEKK